MAIAGPPGRFSWDGFRHRYSSLVSLRPVTFDLRPIGVVESPLVDLADAPKQGDEGAPLAWIAIDPAYAVAAANLEPGSQLIVLTWFHLASRDVLRVHPRSDASRAEQGVFSTRSPDRPNPIGMHVVEIVAVEGNRIQVRDLEAINGTPVVDLKPVLGGISTR
jgi:tRNA-Thr(GGU) m(6)t(6)A37 methyltransferase TsaA